MKKFLCIFLLSAVIFLYGCSEQNHDCNEFLKEIISHESGITVRTGEVSFTLKDGTAVFNSPAAIEGLTVTDGKAIYKDIETALPGNAFFVSDVLIKAIREFEDSGKGFTAEDEGAAYYGYEYDIFVADPIDVKKLTVSHNGTDTVYDIISIKK